MHTVCPCWHWLVPPKVSPDIPDGVHACDGTLSSTMPLQLLSRPSQLSAWGAYEQAA